MNAFRIGTPLEMYSNTFIRCEPVMPKVRMPIAMRKVPMKFRVT